MAERDYKHGRPVKGRYGGTFGQYLKPNESLPKNSELIFNAMCLYLIGDLNGRKYTMQEVADKITNGVNSGGSISAIHRAYYFAGQNSGKYSKNCLFEKIEKYKVTYNDIYYFIKAYPNGTSHFDKEITFEDFLLKRKSDNINGRIEDDGIIVPDFSVKFDDYSMNNNIGLSTLKNNRIKKSNYDGPKNSDFNKLYKYDNSYTNDELMKYAKKEKIKFTWFEWALTFEIVVSTILSFVIMDKRHPKVAIKGVWEHIKNFFYQISLIPETILTLLLILIILVIITSIIKYLIDKEIIDINYMWVRTNDKFIVGSIVSLIGLVVAVVNCIYCREILYESLVKLNWFYVLLLPITLPSQFLFTTGILQTLSDDEISTKSVVMIALGFISTIFLLVTNFC